MQKKKQTKQILSVILAVIFAFAPIFFAGCNFDPDDSNSTGGNSSGNGTITTNYKIGDYLNSIKVSYTVSNLSDDTQNDEIKEYKDQIILLTQMLAADTMVGLLQQYSVSNSNDFDYDLSLTSSSSFSLILKKHVFISVIPYSENIESITGLGDTDDEINQKYKYDKDIEVDGIKLSFGGSIKKDGWIFGKYLDGSQTTFKDYYDAFFKTNSNIEAKNKLTYAILSIVDKFDNVSESDFDTTYKAFLNDYDAKVSSSANFKELSQNLAFNVKHSGLYANSLESKAFKQFILDRVIGTTLVDKDNQLFQVFENGKYTDVSSNSTERFRGETFYYNKDTEYKENETNDISLYINGSNSSDYPTCDQLNERLKLIYKGNDETADPHITGTNVKLWQDIDGDGQIVFNTDIGNVAEANITNESGNNEKVKVPKYRALVGFRNYDYTVEKIIDRVLTDKENKIQVKIKKDNNDSGYESISGSNDPNYPVIANVFSKNYSYTAVEVKGVSNDSSSSCKLPKQAYKSVLLAMKDRTKMSVKNSIGTIYLLLESSTGVKVNVSMYARYYRKGTGFARFGEGDDESTFYKFQNGSGEVDGPYGIDFSGPTIKEGCLFELEFEDLFKNAKFKTDDKTYVSNTQTFDYTYTDEDNVTKTVPIYEIKPFPQDYAKSTETSHASIFADIDYKTKPVYDAQNIEGSTGSLYAYSEKNLVGLDSDDECEFIELMFVTDNDNPFTFGFTGFIPQTELYN